MKLGELVARHGRRPARSVPDWMLGFWKRYSISFADGLTDLHTHVCWLQSRNFTIDLRLPLGADQVPARALGDYTAQELQVLANHEGWTAFSDWDGTQLSWRDTDITLQLHNRWPEAAILKRTGNCMIEHCASNAYVEDWRLQPSAPGLLVGLHLVAERELATGRLRHKGGALIVCGDHAGLVLGRPAQPAGDLPLRQRVAEAGGDVERLRALFDFETSVARWEGDGYTVALSTQPGRIGAELTPLDGFELLPDGRVRQMLAVDGVEVERVFAIDVLEAGVAFDQATGYTPDAAAWQARESPTLTRYTRPLF